MSDFPFRISDSGHLLIEPNLHDGMLVGIHMPSRDALVLSVTDLARKRYSLVMDGTSELFATDVRQGNIISHVSVVRGKEVTRDHLETLGEMDQSIRRSESELSRLLTIIHTESLILLELSPSYGCHLICVARDIRIRRETDDR